MEGNGHFGEMMSASCDAGIPTPYSIWNGWIYGYGYLYFCLMDRNGYSSLSFGMNLKMTRPTFFLPSRHLIRGIESSCVRLIIFFLLNNIQLAAL